MAPFWSDVDLRRDGAVLYEVHSEDNIPSQPLLRNVSSFISARTGASFEGTWMLVVEWDDVHPYPHGIETTDGLVCTYEVCMHATCTAIVSNSQCNSTYMFRTPSVVMVWSQ